MSDSFGTPSQANGDALQWVNMAFGYYSPISINSAQVPSTQTDFPVLVSVTDARFKSLANGGHCRTNFDIRPYTDWGLGTAITGYELERYNASTGEVVMWVKVSSLTSSSTPFVLAYGNSSLTTDGSSTTTWSNNFLSVFHVPDGSSLSLLNSASGSNGTNGAGSSGATATTGFIDGGAAFASATSQFFTSDSFTWPASFTYSVWAIGTSFPSAYGPTLWFNIGPNVNYAALYVKSNGKLACYTNHSNYDGTGSHTLSTGTWYYLTMTYNSSTGGTAGFVNAASDGSGSGTTGALVTGSQVYTVGRDTVNPGNWNGKLDEARMASVVRSADWITTEYNNQSAPGTFETLGTEVAVSAGNTSNFFLVF
jgi:hypothetical protein